MKLSLPNFLFSGRAKELLDYVKGLECASAQRVTQGSETLDELVVKELEKEVERVKERNNKKKKRIKMQVRPHLLYRVRTSQHCIKTFTM